MTDQAASTTNHRRIPEFIYGVHRSSEFGTDKNGKRADTVADMATRITMALAASAVT